jgi:abequosyltransferase
MNNILLSICIPTYNRAKILDNTLNSIFNDIDFDSNSIEVIVSDNFSNDNTYEIVKKYSKVKYFRHQKNTGAYNCIFSLTLATGKYLKIINDTTIFTNGSLKFLINKLESNKENNINLFFFQNQFNNSFNEKYSFSRSEFVSTVSYLNTWLINFGIWKKDLNKIEDIYKGLDTPFPHLYIYFRLININSKTKIYFNDFYKVTDVKQKGDYNLFDVFINKYLSILKSENISFFILKFEKYRLFRNFVIIWMNTLLFRERNKYSYSTKNAISIILKKYWYEFYIYPFFMILFLKNSFDYFLKEKS